MHGHGMTAAVPMKIVGPVKIKGAIVSEEIKVPLATFETPLWATVARGAKVSRLINGITVTLCHEKMTRSVIIDASNAVWAHQVVLRLKEILPQLKHVVTTTSAYAELVDFHAEIIGKLIFLRFSFLTGDAAGHNMVTKAADALLDFILASYDNLEYVTISGNICVDKKNSAINGILGRGKFVIAEGEIKAAVATTHLKTSIYAIHELNIKKNLLGSIIAGSVRSANAHFANMLLAFYLAFGQDAANIVEGSQGFVYTAITNDTLYFSITLPNLILGTVGSGKNFDFVQKNMELVGCKVPREYGYNARRLAAIAAASVWCGELSLLAAQTNKGELMASHLRLERMQN